MVQKDRSKLILSNLMRHIRFCPDSGITNCQETWTETKWYSIIPSYSRRCLDYYHHCEVSGIVSRELKYVLTFSLPRKAFCTVHMTAPLFVVLVIVNSFMYKGLEIFLAYVSA
jgi:hypothetical protein